MKFIKVLDSLFHWNTWIFYSSIFQKSCWLTHAILLYEFVISLNASSFAFSLETPCSSYLLIATSTL